MFCLHVHYRTVMLTKKQQRFILCVYYFFKWFFFVVRWQQAALYLSGRTCPFSRVEDCIDVAELWRGGLLVREKKVSHPSVFLRLKLVRSNIIRAWSLWRDHMKNRWPGFSMMECFTVFYYVTPGRVSVFVHQRAIMQQFKQSVKHQLESSPRYRAPGFVCSPE